MCFIEVMLNTTETWFGVYPKLVLLTTPAENALTYFPEEHVRNSKLLQ